MEAQSNAVLLFFGREVIMGRRWRFWPLTGFLTAAVLGTLAHFAYRWSSGALLAGVFCAVNALSCLKQQLRP